MILPIQDEDFDELLTIASNAIIANVAQSHDDAQKIIRDVKESLNNWKMKKSHSYHAKYIVNDKIAGYIIVKDYWNFSQVFVLPSFQNSGIGRKLVEEALLICSIKSPKGKLVLNSSTNAQGFYIKMGFIKMSEGLDLPGGCIPFEYTFKISK